LTAIEHCNSKLKSTCIFITSASKKEIKDIAHKILVRSSHKLPHFLDVVYTTADLVRHLIMHYLYKDKKPVLIESICF